jgi:transcriptional regulator with XRE-family HTH domain
METKITFGDKLNTLRQLNNLTVQQLADASGVSQPLISNLIHNNRVIGEYTARRIGTALKLQGEALEDFIYSAINGCTEKVLNSSKDYPAEILNLIAGQLSAMGIVPSKIARCIRNPKPDANAALYLNDGKSAYINVEVAFG